MNQPQRTRYTNMQLSQYVRAIIDRKYNSPTSLKTAFAAQFNRAATSLSNRQLIATELEELTGKIAQAVFDDLHLISPEVIERQMSDAIKRENYTQGILLESYAKDFEALAKSLTSELVRLKIKFIKQSLKPKK